MSGLKDKILGKAGKVLEQGSSLPSTGPLKENNPEQGTVDLAKLPGKSAMSSFPYTSKVSTDICSSPPTDIIVGVPGAFTPPCSSQVPGYVEKADAFAAKGIQGIYIVAVNDAFTTQAWAEKLGAKHQLVHFLADDDCSVSFHSIMLLILSLWNISN
jgi:2-Cys peroxiredoxin 5